MLAVLRKFQKVFIVIVAAFMVFSMLFFGASGILQRSPKRAEDKVIGKAIDGSDLKLLKTESLVRFIAADQLDGHLMQRKQIPNFFNDGVIRKDFIETGLGAAIAKRYFDEIKPDLLKRFEQAQKFKPYEHPQGKFLSMEMLWNQFAPDLKACVQRVQSMSFGPEVFNGFAKVYVAQGGLNGEAVRRMLYAQQNQLQWLQPDPYLIHGDLGIFGAHSLDDWFGHRFLEIAAQVIHNGAIEAKNKGYVVTYDEAKADLMQNGYRYLLTGRKDVTAADVKDTFEKQLQFLHMDEKTAIETWQEVLLFRRLFNEVGGSIYTDGLLQKQFDAYAHEGRVVTAYTLPEIVRKNPYKALVYFNLTSEKNNSFPMRSKDLSEIPKELLHERFEVEITSIHEHDLLENVSLKEMLSFELDGTHWPMLKGKFPNLKACETREERIQALDDLPSDMRDQLDAFAREQIINKHPEWVLAALDAAKPETKDISVALAGKREPLEGIKDLDGFRKALKTNDKSLNCYTGDQKHYYRIKVVKNEPAELLTFQEAVEANVVEKLYAAHLEKIYPQIREQSPKKFQNESGSWKAWHEVKEALAEMALKPEFEKRSKNYLKEMRAAFITSNQYKLDGFAKQWELTQVKGAVKRSAPHWSLPDDLIKAEIGSWTDVIASKQGDFLFAHIDENFDPKELTAEYVRSGKELLSREAKRCLLENLLDQMTLAKHV